MQVDNSPEPEPEPEPSKPSQSDRKLQPPPTRPHLEQPQSRMARDQFSAPSASRLPLCAWICLIFIPLLWLAAIVSSTRPFYHIFFTLLSLLPALIVARFVLTRFPDDAVSKSFLLSQFFLGAIPLTLIVVLVETLLLVLIAVLLFSSEIQNIVDIVTSEPGVSRISLHAITRAVDSSFKSRDHPMSKSSDTDKLLQSLGEHIPFWKILVSAVFFALVVAGVTEEVGKWALARRYKEVNSLQENVDWDRRIGCRGILSIACMGALGFATVENYGFVVGLTASPETKFQLAFVALALFRGVLAFPIHVGAQFYVAVAAAQWYVFHEPISVLGSLYVAILLHALFDGISMVTLVLVPKLGLPSWIGVFVPILQCGLTVLLVLLCRGRYKALLERERIVLASSDPV